MTSFIAVTGVLAFFIYVLWRGRRAPPRHGKPRATTSQRPATYQPQAERYDAYPFIDVPTMMQRGDWDGARRALQKMAYEFAGKPADEKAEFTALMARFATLDPLYNRCLKAIAPVVQAQPGIRQTALYPHMPTADSEESRYVLYFAHELGHLVRRKKGNSYEVFLPGQEMPPVQPKRIKTQSEPEAANASRF